MIQRASKNIPYLDGWRGAAIVLVLQAHFFTHAAGRLGVMLFFVLSGYLMAELLFIKQVALNTFFARRISRIFPTVLVFTVAMALYAATLQPKAYQVALDNFLSTLFFMRTYYPNDSSIWTEPWAIGHFWSLNVEEHSYVYLAAGALLLRKLGANRYATYFLAGSAALSFVLTISYFITPPVTASPWFVRSECAALGLLSSAALRVIRSWTPWVSVRNGHPAIPLLFLALGVACFLPPARASFEITLAPVFLAVSINYLDRAPRWLHRLLSLAALRWFGLCSFSLYIWQQPFYMANTEFGMQQQLAGLLAILAGTLAFHVLENPSRVALNRYWDRRQQHRLAAASMTGTAS